MIPANLYTAVYLNLLLFLTIIYIVNHNSSDAVLKNHNNYGASWCFCIAMILFLGLRPVSYHFGDTVNYAETYNLMKYDATAYDGDTSEWLFMWIMDKCSKSISIHAFFLLIEIGYIGCLLWASRRLTPNNTWVTVLINFAAFSFFSFGTNGIRNGLACSIMLVAFSYVLGSKRDKIICALLCFCAYNIHHSTALPILMMAVSAFFIHNLKLSLCIWVVSIFLSLTVGGWLENFFASLGFDERLNSYILSDDYDDQFSDTGFRWDFLLYSIMPIILGCYVIIKRKITDKTYSMLLNTYILCNAFWIMVIKASFSARFAYLSWFIYPMLLAYPLLRLPIWRDQSLKLNWIMTANIGFTYFMWLIGKYH